MKKSQTKTQENKMEKTTEINKKRPVSWLTRTENPKIDTGEGLTEQSHKKECDMNYILREYTRTGFIKHANDNKGTYDDIPVTDFQEAMFIVGEGNRMFNELPGHVRKALDNSPEKFLEFVQNPENKSKMEELGILVGNDGIDMHGMPSKAPVADAPPKIQPVESPENTTGEDAK